MSAVPYPPDFRNRRVLALESRRATEVATMVARFGGQPLIAPAVREVPLESNAAALELTAALLLGEIDILVLLTSVGARALLDLVGRAYPAEDVPAILKRTRVAARGPKPAGALRELGIDVWVSAPEPSTWRELLSALDARASERPIAGARIAVQEYGVPNEELLEALASRGAAVMRVPIYRWALPDDVGPLQRAVTAICEGQADVLLVTSGVQLEHLWQVVGMMGCEEAFRAGLASTFVASIGPTTSDALAQRGIKVHLQASHPRLGLLVREAALHATDRHADVAVA